VVVQMVVEVTLSFPPLLLAIVVVAILGPGLENALIALAIGGVPYYARLVRGQVLTLKQRPFVLAAEASGARPVAILIGHVLPNLAGVAIAYLLLTIPQVVMVESFLSFLGLGVQEPLTSLGILVKDGADDMDIAPHALLLPGGMLVLILVALTLAGERLRDRFAR